MSPGTQTLSPLQSAKVNPLEDLRKIHIEKMHVYSKRMLKELEKETKKPKQVNSGFETFKNQRCNKKPLRGVALLI